MREKCYVVPVQKKCNMNCCFCSTKLRLYDRDQEIMVLDRKFYDNLEYFRERGVHFFEFTGGGEPFLNLELQNIIDSIRECIPKAFIKVYTNGKIHRKIDGINELDISVVHWDKNAVLKLCDYEDKMSLEEHLSFFRENGSYRIRLSVPMVKGGISSAEKALTLIKKTEKYVDCYVFRPLNPKTNSYETLATDFDLNVRNAEIDREFCDCEKVDLWFADNGVYRDWDLQERIR